MNPIYLVKWEDDKLKNQTHKPIQNKTINAILTRITNKNKNSFSGCWDILAWKKNKVLFIESKRAKKDSIRNTQTNWLKSGLRCGLKPSNFMIVQWDFSE